MHDALCLWPNGGFDTESQPTLKPLENTRRIGLLQCTADPSHITAYRYGKRPIECVYCQLEGSTSRAASYRDNVAKAIAKLR